MTTGPTGLYASLKVASGLLAYGQLLYEKKLKKWSDSMGALYYSYLTTGSINILKGECARIIDTLLSEIDAAESLKNFPQLTS